MMLVSTVAQATPVIFAFPSRLVTPYEQPSGRHVISRVHRAIPSTPGSCRRCFMPWIIIAHWGSALPQPASFHRAFATGVYPFPQKQPVANKVTQPIPKAIQRQRFDWRTTNAWTGSCATKLTRMFAQRPQRHFLEASSIFTPAQASWKDLPHGPPQGKFAPEPSHAAHASLRVESASVDMKDPPSCFQGAKCSTPILKLLTNVPKW